MTSAAQGRLVLTIEVPDFFVGDIEETLHRVGIDPTPENVSEEVEQAMALASPEVGLTFNTYEGDAPQTFMKVMLGRVLKAEVRADDIPF